MSSPAVLLELIGQALLPVMASSDPFAVAPSPLLIPKELPPRARDVWGGWARDRDAAGRQADLAALAGTAADGLAALVADVARRVLPGRPDAAGAALSRYLAAVPALARRLEGQPL